MKKIFFGILIVAALCVAVHSLKDSVPKTPVWAPYFDQQFVEGYSNAGSFRTLGTYWYDAQRNFSKVERLNGMHDPICGSVLPNVPTDCVQLTRDSKRYIIYPLKRLCCICCDAAHGCGILKRDWLSSSKYEGQ